MNKRELREDIRRNPFAWFLYAWWAFMVACFVIAFPGPSLLIALIVWWIW